MDKPAITSTFIPFPNTFETIYVTSEQEADDRLNHITNGVVGFDTEFRPRHPTYEESIVIEAIHPSINKKSALLGWQIVEMEMNKPFPIAWENMGLRLVQIAYENTVLVLDLKIMRGTTTSQLSKPNSKSVSRIQALPIQLRRILESPKIIKAGAGLGNDIKVLWDDLRINVNNMVDISYMARLELCEANHPGGYASLAMKTCVEQILGYSFAKDMQKSDWSVDQLTKEQLHYAALDAFASKQLHMQLKEALKIKAQDKSALIPRSWYTFNGKMGEQICINNAFDGSEMLWKPADCTWYSGGKFIGYWPNSAENV